MSGDHSHQSPKIHVPLAAFPRVSLSSALFKLQWAHRPPGDLGKTQTLAQQVPGGQEAAFLTVSGDAALTGPRLL